MKKYKELTISLLPHTTRLRVGVRPSCDFGFWHHGSQHTPKTKAMLNLSYCQSVYYKATA